MKRIAMSFAALLFALPLSAEMQTRKFYVNNAAGIRLYIEDSHTAGSTDVSIESLTRDIDTVRLFVTAPSGGIFTFLVDFRDVKGPGLQRVIATVPMGVQQFEKLRLEVHRLPVSVNFE